MSNFLTERCEWCGRTGIANERDNDFNVPELSVFLRNPVFCEICEVLIGRLAPAASRWEKGHAATQALTIVQEERRGRLLNTSTYVDRGDDELSLDVAGGDLGEEVDP